MPKALLIFDFDSTIIPEESLDELILISQKSTKNNAASSSIDSITKRAMNGEISFSQSLSQRFKHIDISQTHIEEYVKYLFGVTDPSMIHLIQSLKDEFDVWVLSGGFDAWIVPFCTRYLNINSNHVVTNQLLIKNGRVVGYNEDNKLISKGKEWVVEHHIKPQSDANHCVMIGDGFTDYMVYKTGAADHFIGVGIYAVREQVKKHAPCYVQTVGELSQILHNL